MKCLSIQNPWAWSIIFGQPPKPWENRDWYCGYRGPLLIHTGKRIDPDGYDYIEDILGIEARTKAEWFSQACSGGIIGRVEMTDCVDVRNLSTLRLHQGKPGGVWLFGNYGFRFENPQPLPFRPLRGQLGLFEVEGY